MRAIRLLMVAALLAIGASGAAAARGSDTIVLSMDLRNLVERAQAGDRTVAPELARAAEELTNVIEGGGLSPLALANARYLRGLARLHEYEIRKERQETIDPSGVRQTLGDFAAVIEAMSADPGAGSFISNVEYMAGGVAFNFLNDASTGYHYWERCAQTDHAGCMNVIAEARLTGVAGQRVDIQEAMDIHRRIVATGTKFSCAGAYSALSLATISFFHDVRRPGEDEAVWLGTAYALLDELGARLANKDPCERSRFEVVDYLFRLSKGDRREQLLRAALERAALEQDREIVRYFLGTADAAAARAAAVSEAPPFTRCARHFTLLWHAVIGNDREAATSHRRSLEQIGSTHCGSELLYARKLGF